jgi:hypothetical protein
VSGSAGRVISGTRNGVSGLVKSVGSIVVVAGGLATGVGAGVYHVGNMIGVAEKVVAPEVSVEQPVAPNKAGKVSKAVREGTAKALEAGASFLRDP